MYVKFFIFGTLKYYITSSVLLNKSDNISIM